MKISSLLSEASIDLASSATTKDEALEALVALHEKAGNLADTAAFRKAIDAREALGSTAVSEGLAIPHAQSDAVAQAGLAALVVPEGVDYGAEDGPVTLLFMIASPAGAPAAHLEVLSNLVAALGDGPFRTDLAKAASPAEFIEVMASKDN